MWDKKQLLSWVRPFSKNQTLPDPRSYFSLAATCISPAATAWAFFNILGNILFPAWCWLDLWQLILTTGVPCRLPRVASVTLRLSHRLMSTVDLCLACSHFVCASGFVVGVMLISTDSASRAQVRKFFLPGFVGVFYF